MGLAVHNESSVTPTSSQGMSATATATKSSFDPSVPRTVLTATRARRESLPDVDVERFTSQSYTHIILSTGANTAPLALRMGIFLASSNKSTSIGVVAAPLSPRALACLDTELSTTAPTNIKVLAEAAIAPTVICGGTSPPTIQGVRLTADHVAGAKREVVICCDPEDSPESIAAMLDNAFAKAADDIGDVAGPGRGLTAKIKDLRVVPLKDMREADRVAGWVLEAWAQDERV